MSRATTAIRELHVCKACGSRDLRSADIWLGDCQENTTTVPLRACGRCGAVHAYDQKVAAARAGTDWQVVAFVSSVPLKGPTPRRPRADHEISDSRPPFPDPGPER